MTKSVLIGEIGPPRGHSRVGFALLRCAPRWSQNPSPKGALKSRLRTATLRSAMVAKHVEGPQGGRGRNSDNTLRQVITMSTVQELKTAIKLLPEEDYDRLRKWFVERDWKLWDIQLKKDSDAGRLNFLIEEAIHEKAGGELREL